MVKFYNFCTVLLILRTTTNSAKNYAHAESQNSDIPSIFCQVGALYDT